MDTLRSLGTRVCTMYWVVGIVCVISFAGYQAFALYLSRTSAADLIAIEQRLSAIEAKQDEILKLLQPHQAPQLSPEQEASLSELMQHMPTQFEILILDRKLAVQAF